MRLYWEIALRGFRRHTEYWGATWAGLFTNTIFGFMRAYVLIAMFRSREVVGGFDVADALTYTFLTQGLIMTVSLWGWWDIAAGIQSGDVVTDLFRPLDYQFYWLARDLGRAAFQAIFRGLPPFAVGAVAFDLRLPVSPATWVVFLCSLTLAVCVSYAMRFILNLCAFWLLDYRGVGTLFTAALTFFSGFVIPITFFPSWLRTVAEVLPFAATIQVPVEIFLEKGDAAAGLGSQLAWAAVLLVAGRFVLAAATRRVVTHGG